MFSFTFMNQELYGFMAEHSENCFYVRFVGIQGVRPGNGLRSRQPEFRTHSRTSIPLPP